VNYKQASPFAFDELITYVYLFLLGSQYHHKVFISTVKDINFNCIPTDRRRHHHHRRRLYNNHVAIIPFTRVTEKYKIEKYINTIKVKKIKYIVLNINQLF
jgi:hypothetical protein